MLPVTFVLILFFKSINEGLFLRTRLEEKTISLFFFKIGADFF